MHNAYNYFCGEFSAADASRTKLPQRLKPG
jgi:hypothetical protein